MRALLAVVAVGAALFASTFLSSPLPLPAPYDGPLPPANPPPTMRAYRLPTGVTHRSAAFAYRGGSLFDKRDFAMTAVLVRHPGGDVLIDTGFGRDVAAHLRAMPLAFRAVTSYTRGRSAAAQLDAAGYNRHTLRAILLTHAHWDHVSGVPDLADTPVWIPQEERRFIDDGGVVSAVARQVDPRRFETYRFEGGAYLGFARSHDVYGDGALVVVPAPGHTPGSVIAFLTLPDRQRFAFLGDLVWQREGITLREERPWVWRFFGDDDPTAVRGAITHVAAIARRFPEMVLAPAHDARGFAALPLLTP